MENSIKNWLLVGVLVVGGLGYYESPWIAKKVHKLMPMGKTLSPVILSEFRIIFAQFFTSYDDF